jgi:hypothetical protein
MAGIPKNYGELIQAVGGYLLKRNLAAEITGFIAGAESDINSRLRDRRMIKTSEATTDCGSISLPSGWLDAVRVRMVGASKALDFATLDQAPTLYDGSGAPTHYSIRGNVMEITPTPPTSAKVELIFYDSITPLSDLAPTNWLLEQEPMLYIYGACLHAAPFLMDDERVPAWEAYFSGRIGALNEATQRSQFSGAPLVRRRRGFG